MRNRIVLGCAVAFLSTAGCTAATFVGNDAGEDAGQGDSAVHPNSGGDDAGSDAPATVDAAPPPNCDATKLPTEDACVVNDAYGVFVSSSLGTAAGNGTQAKPFASLNAAIIAAKAANRRVYACADVYSEHVDFLDGVSVFGYFACSSNWAVVQTAHAKVVAPASPAATAANITTPTRIEAVDLASPDFTTGSQSSIALVATGSPALEYVNGTIHAGTGGKGADGADAAPLNNSGKENGEDAWSDGVCGGNLCPVFVYYSPAPGSNACVGAGGYVGGPGGAGGQAGQFQSAFDQNKLAYVWKVVNSLSATVGSPTTATPETALGGGWNQAGAPGMNGQKGTDGTTGADFGVLSAAGYTPSDGTDGVSGQPGQGGGGAGAAPSSLSSDFAAGSNYVGYNGRNEPGAGGGAGGCPGVAGTAGKGGGASIAILAVASPFTLDHATVESSAGGQGGAAGTPSAATSGGKGGKGYQHTQSGGNGGSGGAAGVSGNGGGGPSIAIASQGKAPTQLACTVKSGPGGGGVASRTVNNSTIPASPSGLSQDAYAF